MKTFLLRALAALGAFSLLAMLVGGLSAWAWYTELTEPQKTPDEMVLVLNLADPVSETLTSFGFTLESLVYEETRPTPLIYIIRALENAKNDPKIKGVIARFGAQTLPLVHVQEIAKALGSFRESGKFTAVYATSYGNFASGSTNYLLANYFEHIWLQPIGSVGLTNLGAEAPFGKTALGKLGITTDFLRREEYKSVMENMERDSFSPPVKANMESLIGNLNNQIAQGLAAGRKIDLAKAKELLSGGPYTTNEAVKLGLVTKAGYQDEFFDEAEAKTSKQAELVDPASYLSYFMADHDAEESKATIALIIADGMIVEDAPKGPARLAEEEIINTETIVQAFDDAVKDEDVKAILFRVNSPGGSPVASETIRRALVNAKESKKPVFVSMGRVAASGGYWIAMDADRIFADPATLTGSIGVVAGKFVLGELFDKLGIKWDTITTGENASMWSARAPFSAKSRERMNAMLDETYKAFTDHVIAARKLPPEKIPEIAKGRVFTGEQAVQVGLVDELGGMNETILGLKKALNMKPEDRVFLSAFPPPETPASLFFQILENLQLGGAMVREALPVWRDIKAQIAPVARSIIQPDGANASLPTAFRAYGF